MSRLPLLPLAAMFAGIVTAAPVPRGKPLPACDYPTAVGTRWVYQLPSGDYMAEVITEATTWGEWTVLKVDNDDGSGSQGWRYLKVSAAGVVCLNGDGSEVDEVNLPFLLKTPAVPDAEWERGGFSCVIRGLERVKVPTGVYDAVRVDTDYRCVLECGPNVGLPYRVVSQAWYAHRVGMIQQESMSKLGDESFSPVIRSVLKSFTPGKG